MKAPAPCLTIPISTADGTFAARYSQKGLCSLDFPRRTSSPVRASDIAAAPLKVREWHEKTTTCLLDVLAGRPHRNLPPLDLSAGTAFQQQVWNALRRISLGNTLSYGEVARAVGRPKALRAVGGACGANPIPLLIPCHRVLAAGQKIGGFSGGLNWKRTLLRRENIAVC